MRLSEVFTVRVTQVVFRAVGIGQPPFNHVVQRLRTVLAPHWARPLQHVRIVPGAPPEGGVVTTMAYGRCRATGSRSSHLYSR